MGRCTSRPSATASAPRTDAASPASARFTGARSSGSRRPSGSWRCATWAHLSSRATWRGTVCSSCPTRRSTRAWSGSTRTCLSRSCAATARRWTATKRSSDYLASERRFRFQDAELHEQPRKIINASHVDDLSVLEGHEEHASHLIAATRRLQPAKIPQMLSPLRPEERNLVSVDDLVLHLEFHLRKRREPVSIEGLDGGAPLDAAGDHGVQDG